MAGWWHGDTSGWDRGGVAVLPAGSLRCPHWQSHGSTRAAGADAQGHSLPVPCTTLPVCPWTLQCSTGRGSVAVVWLCCRARSRVLGLCSGWGEQRCPGGLMGGKRGAEVGSGSTPDPGRCWVRDLGCPGPARAPLGFHPASASQHRAGCVSQFTLLTEAGRGRERLEDPGLEAVWAGGGISPCLQCV